MSRSKDIGTAGERAVVAYLRSHGWSYAERRALAGAQDRGDITGTPALCWEIKSGRAAETASDGLVGDWLEETAREAEYAHADLGVLVLKRGGYGPARVASWWAILPARHLAPVSDPLGEDIAAQPTRLHLSTMVALLHHWGYGGGA